MAKPRVGLLVLALYLAAVAAAAASSRSVAASSGSPRQPVAPSPLPSVMSTMSRAVPSHSGRRTPIDLPPEPPAGLKAFRFAPPASPHSPSTFAGPGMAATAPTVSQDDFELADVALVTTLDGRVHALRRETGQWVWTLHDPGGKGNGILSEPLVSAERGGGGSSPAQGASNGTGGNKAVAVPNRQRQAQDPGEEAELEEIYAIEPHSDGDIYVYVRSGAGGNLQKLPLSVSELVNLSPFTFPGDQSKMFVGKKETKLVGVDLKTGKLVGVFGPGEGWCEWKEEGIDEACDDGIAGRPEDLLYMGRTDYHVSIYSKPGGLLQTLKYSTYGPSNLADDLQSAWTRTPDERYLEPMHDGNLVCYRAGGDGLTHSGSLQWRNAFDCPVTSVFDVAYPKRDSAMGGALGGDPGLPRSKAFSSPVLFPQPRPQPTAGVTPPGPFDALHASPDAPADRAFVGRHGNSYFAMSRERFPLVAFAPPASVEMLDASGPGDPGEQEKTTIEDSGIVGTHMLDLPETVAPGHLIEADKNRLGIDPPPADGSIATEQLTIQPPPSPPTQRAAQMTSLFGQRVRDQLSLSSSRRDPRDADYGTNPVFSVLFVMGILGWVAARKFWGKKWDRELEKRARRVGRDWFGVGAGRLTEEEREAAEKEKALKELLGTDAGVKEGPAGSAARVAEPATPTVAATPPPFAALDGEEAAKGRPAASPKPQPKRVRIASLTSKALPPLPTDEEGEEGKEGEEESDADGEDKENKEENGVAKPKRPRRVRKRGRRPGQKAAAAAAAAAAALEAEALGAEAVDGKAGPKAAEADLARLVLRDRAKYVEPPPGSPELGEFEPHRVGSLVVTDETLGYGSHGTVVVKGTFQGREVAVKRLLKDFVTLATHEVSLLQESDDHPNVVRYFVKESKDNFLYIALELCPASLFDVIERTRSHPTLEAAFAPKKALKQITAGLRHLHKLKIVHRDIKPQNILVSMGRNGHLRMLISDFGLCKKLEVDESSFAQTANHAAGSFGYRAPEILRGQVNPNDQTATPSSSTHGSATIGEAGASGGGSEATHRLTRSIDIFSLGCIFYYVLTKGEHPFGSKYEREVNILKDEVCLDQLDGFDEEAHEAQDLIRSMVRADPRSRPNADEIIQNPYFWTAAQRLLFLCDASDRFEIMERDPPAPPLVALEGPELVASVVGEDWHKRLDRALIDNLGKYRKYDGGSIRDLLRVLRNKKHHYQDFPDGVKKTLGEPPDGFLSYFTRRFPSLLLHVYSVVKTHLRQEPMFAQYFDVAEDA